MSFRSSSLSCATLLAAAAALIAVKAPGAEQRPGRSIEFSEPRSAESITNMDRLTGKKNLLKQWEEDLNKPLTPRTSLDGFMEPPQQRRRGPSPLQMKKARENMDRQRNWVFVDPDEQATGTSAEEIFNIPEYDADGQEKKKLSVFEQYLQNQERKKVKGKDEKANRDKAGGEDYYGSDKDSDTWNSWDDSEPKDGKKGSSDRDRGLKNIFGNDNSGLSPVQRGTFTDIFGLADKAASAEDAAKHKAYLDEFRSLLSSGGKAPHDNFSLPTTLPDSSKSSLSAVGGWESFPGAAQRENSGSFSAGKSSFSSAAAHNPFSDFNSKGFNSPVSTPIPAASTKSTPTVPTFSAPRRSF
jgi:hypothetical protein